MLYPEGKYKDLYKTYFYKDLSANPTANPLRIDEAHGLEHVMESIDTYMVAKRRH